MILPCLIGIATIFVDSCRGGTVSGTLLHFRGVRFNLLLIRLIALALYLIFRPFEHHMLYVLCYADGQTGHHSDQVYPCSVASISDLAALFDTLPPKSTTLKGTIKTSSY